jgi:phosphate:Na+ symporter
LLNNSSMEPFSLVSGMIGAVTNNLLSAVGVGVFVTCLVQSSSITTVMVVGFVNGSLMTLTQAVGVIMGANVGTTITGWILVLKIGKYGLPILGTAAFVYLFSKNERLRYIAMAVMGVGMVFFGLELMKDACSHIKELPEFNAWLGGFSATTYIGMIQCMLTGCVLTIMVQSSSATLGITIALAVTGAINYETAAALVLGENIGTTITALLASIGATTNARRAAYFHTLFNLIGVTWIGIIFFQYVEFVPWIIGADVNNMVLQDGVATFPQRLPAIAATHTIFNVTNTVIFLPFAYKIAHMLERVVPDRAAKEIPHLTNLDVRMLETPVIGIEQSRVEILHMADSCQKMMTWLRQLISEDEPDPKLVQKLFHREEVLDTMQDEVVAFLTNLLAANAPHHVIKEGRCQLRMADEYESISDCVTSILKFRLKLDSQGHRLDEKSRDEIISLHDSIADYLQLISGSYQKRQMEVITKANSLGAEITARVRQLRDNHISQLSEDKIEPHVNLTYTSTLATYRTVRDHVLNVAEAMDESK